MDKCRHNSTARCFDLPDHRHKIESTNDSNRFLIKITSAGDSAF